MILFWRMFDVQNAHRDREMSPHVFLSCLTFIAVTFSFHRCRRLSSSRQPNTRYQRMKITTRWSATSFSMRIQTRMATSPMRSLTAQNTRNYNNSHPVDNCDMSLSSVGYIHVFFFFLRISHGFIT